MKYSYTNVLEKVKNDILSNGRSRLSNGTRVYRVDVDDMKFERHERSEFFVKLESLIIVIFYIELICVI